MTNLLENLLTSRPMTSNQKTIASAVLAALATLAAIVLLTLFPGRSDAATTEGLVWGTCPNLVQWHVNDDETDRQPEATADGLKFTGPDLIHHATSLDVEALSHGSYAASPAPDQPSFFSVEVYGSDGAYGTLRWNMQTSKWNLVSKGAFYENASAVALVDMPPVKLSHKVVSFGVGYTANPPGTVATIVSGVTFAGVTYPLTCKPKPSTSASTPATTPKQCEAYVYTGSKYMLCDRFPDATKDTVNCTLVKYRVTSVHKTDDPWRLDQDGNGIGCEANPVRHFPSKTPDPVVMNSAGDASGALAVTGPSGWAVGAVAVGLAAFGGALLIVSRRRKTTWRA